MTLNTSADVFNNVYLHFNIPRVTVRLFTEYVAPNVTYEYTINVSVKIKGVLETCGTISSQGTLINGSFLQHDHLFHMARSPLENWNVIPHIVNGVNISPEMIHWAGHIARQRLNGVVF